MRLVNGFMENSNLTKELRIKIRKYYEYYFRLKSEDVLTTH